VSVARAAQPVSVKETVAAARTPARRRCRLALAIGTLAVVASAGAAAQTIDGRFFLSSDSDDFTETRLGIGYAAANGFGVAAGALRYRAPGWSESGAALGATYTDRSDTRDVDASLGVLDLAGRQDLVGSLDFVRRWSGGRALGVALERHVVASRAGIEDHILYNVAALVGDWAFTPIFNVGVAAGLTHFTDGNDRPFLRTRWNLELVAEYGLNGYLKTRSYRNTDPGRPQYYSPERLNEISLGLSARWRATEAVVASLGIDAGEQSTETGHEPIWAAVAGLASPRGAPLRWSVGLLATNTASLFTTQTGAYRYLSLVAQTAVPF
jgi:hypothetical protein